MLAVSAAGVACFGSGTRTEHAARRASMQRKVSVLVIAVAESHAVDSVVNGSPAARAQVVTTSARRQPVVPRLLEHHGRCDERDRAYGDGGGVANHYINGQSDEQRLRDRSDGDI